MAGLSHPGMGFFLIMTAHLKSRLHPSRSPNHRVAPIEFGSSTPGCDPLGLHLL